MRGEVHDKPPKLRRAFRWTLLGLFLLAVIWAVVRARTVHHVEIHAPGQSIWSPRYDRLEIVRLSGSLLALDARGETASYEDVRWPVPDGVRLDTVASIRLVDLGSRRVVDEVEVSGTSLASQSFVYEIGTRIPVLTALQCFFGTPLVVLIGAASIAFLVFYGLEGRR
jgi:hypothetical protein